MCQESCSTLFWTLSYADGHWPDLHRLLPWIGPDSTSSERRLAVDRNPHIVDKYFTLRTQAFCSTFFDNYLGTKWNWYR